MCLGDILVAGIAVTIRWVDNQVRMCQFLILLLTVATMADNATHLAMGALQELGILDENFFPYLQRR